MEFGQYQTFDDFLDEIKVGFGKNFLRNKVNFALSIKDFLLKEDLANIYDIKDSMNKLIYEIKKWNSLD
jgi:hypothetical protein